MLEVMEKDIFKREYYDFGVPDTLIAQSPLSQRDCSRLLMINRRDKTVKEGYFRDILEFLQRGDVLVLNDTKVIKAALTAKKYSGAKIEILLLKKVEDGIWSVLVKPGKKVKIGDNIVFDGKLKLSAEVLSKTSQGGRILKFIPQDCDSVLELLGKVPLPPYIKADVDDVGKYQTVFAKNKGAVAAPTAGLHFTKELMEEIENKGVKIIYITLHCGLATFRPIKSEDIREHKIEPEWMEITPAAAEIVNKAKKEHQRVIAAGTTVIRALESAVGISVEKEDSISPFCGETSLFITPGYKFRVIDAVITNFHTPYSTNLALIASFCCQDLLKRAYKHAVDRKFRFYSFGDACLII